MVKKTITKTRKRAQPKAKVKTAVPNSLFTPPVNLTENVVYNSKGLFNQRKRSTLPPIVESYVDPFSQAAVCKYPDEYRGLTVATSSKFRYKMQTLPAGGYTDTNLALNNAVTDLDTCVFCVTPDPNACLIQGNSGTPSGGLFAGVVNTMLWPNGIVYTNATGTLNAFGPTSGNVNVDNVVSNIGDLKLRYNSVRCVSAGVKIFSTQSFSNISGTIRIAPVYINLNFHTTNLTGVLANPVTQQLQNSWSDSLPFSVSQMMQLPGYQEFPLSALESNEIIAVLPRISEEALQFKSSKVAWGIDTLPGAGLATRSGNTGMLDGYGHMCILVVVDGYIPSTGKALGNVIGEVEVQYNYECTETPQMTQLFPGPLTSSFSTTSVATPAAPFQPILMAAANNMSSLIPVVRTTDVGGATEIKFMEKVAGAWKTAVKIAGTVGSVVDVIGPALAAMVI